MPTQCTHGKITVAALMGDIEVNYNLANAAQATADTATTINATQDIAISNHEDRIVILESTGALSDISALTDRLTNVESETADNLTSIGTNTTNIATNTIDLSNVAAEAAANTISITALQGGVSGIPLVTGDATSDPSVTNQVVMTEDLDSEISSLGNYIDNPIYERKDKNFLSMEHRELTTVSGGDSTAGAWEIRTISSLPSNYIGGILTGNILTLMPGLYHIDGYAECTSGYNQTRLYDQDNAVALVVGSSQDGGKSIIRGEFSIAATTNVVVETQVDTSGVDAFGVPNPFDDGVFTFITITLIGV